MFKINNESNQLIIVIHEIYGVNPYIMDLSRSLAEQNMDVICPNLLEQEKPFEYSQEIEAYHHFTDNIGFLNGMQRIKDVLMDVQGRYSKIFILGNSIGATLAWLCSEEDGIDGVIGYYGSRIRDYVDIIPKCPVLLFFPETERNFQVNVLVSKLNKPKVDVRVCKAEHGFNDPYSSTYNEELAKYTFGEILEFIQRNGVLPS